MKIYNIIIFIIMANWAWAQTPISLEEAFKKASENNAEIKLQNLYSDYFESLQNSSKVIEPLGIAAEYGQINSSYLDNRVVASQSFKFPGFYKSQKQVLIEQWKKSTMNTDMKRWQLKRDLSLVYNELNYLENKGKLLKAIDSVYANYYRVASLRLNKGESNILEKTTAENYRAQAAIQLENLQSDREIVLYQFNFLINENQMYTARSIDFYQKLQEPLGTNYNGNVYVLQMAEQDKNIAAAKVEAEKAKLKPSFALGYQNSSFTGLGPDDKYYPTSRRFNAGILGINIPIFTKAQKAVINSEKIQQQIADSNYEFQQKQLQKEYAILMAEIQKLNKEQSYYSSQGMNNAQTILNTANRLYSSGEINYLDWSLLVKQSFEIQNIYLDNQKVLNEKWIQIKALQDENL